jgi:hypothetical protein
MWRRVGVGGVNMVEVRVTTKKVVALVLSEQEARWLKGVMQNPLFHDESEEDSVTRYTIFNGLKDAGIQ